MAIIEGTYWDDDLFGFDTDDFIYGYDGDDDIYAYDGDDDIYGGNGSDLIAGGFDADLIYGGAGNDALYGEVGNDDLYGGAGNERLFGGSGQDDLYGGSGSDRLNGGASSDRLIGGSGKDYLAGGSSSDAFVFTRGTSGLSSATADVITDWNAAYDEIDTPVRGTYFNYGEAATTATSIATAAAQADAWFPDPTVQHVFLFNPYIDKGFLISDLNSDGAFETGVVLNKAGYESDFSYLHIV